MIRILTLYSPFETPKQVNDRWGPFLNKLQKDHGHDVVGAGSWNDPHPLQEALLAPGSCPQGLILVMASGGTERLAHLVAKTYRKPLMLVCDGRKNSLAAALEVYSVIRHKIPAWLFYVDDHQQTPSLVVDFIKSIKALENINRARLGVIGEPSPWLLTSDELKGFGGFSTTLVHLPIGRLLQEYQVIETQQAESISNTLDDEYGSIQVSRQSVVDSSRAYLAMRSIISSHRLDGITIRCFDLLPHGFTACMGMSLCADQGYVAACEGDLPAMFSLLLARELSGQPAWMANPSSVDLENNTITFAHCTLPASMLEGKKHSTLTTHMESGLSTAISGPLKMREVTIIRCASTFDSLQVSSGHIVNAHLQHPDLCRTQAVIKLHSKVSDWLENVRGNHQIIIYGNLMPELEVFSRLAGMNIER
ncbi:MAG: hypothetical protein R6U64_05270 [Bacteroidales bacterium]